MGPSRDGVGKDNSQRSSHIVGQPHSDQIEDAKLGEDHEKIRLLAIKFAGIYMGIEAVQVDRDDPAAKIMLDLATGFGAMSTNEMATISQSLGGPEEKESIEGAIREASWAGTRDTRAFYKVLAESLGQGNPSKNQDYVTTGSKRETAMETESRKNERTVFEGGGKMSPAEYSAGVNALTLKLADEVLFDEGGVMAATAIWNREAPCLQAKEELKNDADIEAILEREFENEVLASDRETWKVVRQAIFNEFIDHCTPRMQEDLSNMAGWEAIETSEDGIELIRLMDHAMRQQVMKTIAGCTAAGDKATRATKNEDKAAHAAATDKAARAAAADKAARAAATDKAVRAAATDKATRASAADKAAHATATDKAAPAAATNKAERAAVANKVARAAA